MSSEIGSVQYRIYQNDVHALKELYDMLGNQLLLLAEGITGCRQIAEEVVQDVFIKIWQKRHTLIDVENLKWYLYVSTRNMSIRYIRKFPKLEKVSLEEASTQPFQIDATPEDLMVTAEVIKKINEAINDLPPRCRLIFKMVKDDGLKYREVAELLDISMKTVENQVGIALKKLHLAIAMEIPSSFYAKQLSSGK